MLGRGAPPRAGRRRLSPGSRRSCARGSPPGGRSAWAAGVGLATAGAAPAGGARAEDNNEEGRREGRGPGTEPGKTPAEANSPPGSATSVEGRLLLLSRLPPPFCAKGCASEVARKGA